MEYPNVVLIVADALRARNLPHWGYPAPTAPNITNLAQKSIVFKRAYSQMNYTTPSVASMLTGQYHSGHGLLKLYLQENDMIQCSTLADSLNETHKTIFVNESMLTLLDKSGHLWKNFDYAPSGYKGKWSYARDKKFEKIYPSAKETTNTAISSIVDEPFFMYVHYWDTHYPFDCPSEYADMYYNEKYQIEIEVYRNALKPVAYENFDKHIPDDVSLSYLIAWYDGELTYMDEHIGRLLEALPKDTMIAFVSDHGEEIGERGKWFGHSHNLLHEEVIHVPMIIHYPDNSSQTIFDIAETRMLKESIESYALRREKRFDLLGYSYSACRKRNIVDCIRTDREKAARYVYPDGHVVFGYRDMLHDPSEIYPFTKEPTVYEEIKEIIENITKNDSCKYVEETEYE